MGGTAWKSLGTIENIENSSIIFRDYFENSLRIFWEKFETILRIVDQDEEGAASRRKGCDLQWRPERSQRVS